MICSKCNQKLPDDSEFCQYCGNKIEKVVAAPAEAVVEEPKQASAPVVDFSSPVVSAAPVVENEKSIDDISTDKTLHAILKMQVKNTVEAMEANSKTQPDNEGDADFGLVPEKPIFTLAFQSVDGEKEYLNRLYTTNGERIRYSRRGSTSVAGINGMIDIYETFLPSGHPYKTIYINMYGAKKSTKAPDGFVLTNPAAQIKPAPEKAKPAKVKYCSRCGSVIDGKTKICTGCGKQYFRGISFTRSSVVVIVLVFVIAAVSTLCVLQYVNAQNLKVEISNLKAKVIVNQATINRLTSDLSNYNRLRQFVDDCVVIVCNDGTSLYHKFECSEVLFHRAKGGSIWVYNPEAAEGRGYTACPACH